MNIQLKDLKDILVCKGIHLKRNDISEEWKARLSDFEAYEDMYVKTLYYDNENLIIELQKEPTEI